jgi:hypothetical protein
VICCDLVVWPHPVRKKRSNNRKETKKFMTSVRRFLDPIARCVLGIMPLLPSESLVGNCGGPAPSLGWELPRTRTQPWLGTAEDPHPALVGNCGGPAPSLGWELRRTRTQPWLGTAEDPHPALLPDGISGTSGQMWHLEDLYVGIIQSENLRVSEP